MLKKSISKSLTAGAIALGIAGLNASVTLSQTATENNTPSQLKTTFVCATNSNPPTTFALTYNEKGQATLTPIMSWHSEYLISGDSAESLCQQVAQKLQSKYDRAEEINIAFQQVQVKKDNQGVERQWNVCLAPSAEAECIPSTNEATNQASSEELFSLNNNYIKTPECLMENKEPESCMVNPQAKVATRGPLLVVPASNYQPRWLRLFWR
jgi:hypothetical protein